MQKLKDKALKHKLIILILALSLLLRLFNIEALTTFSGDQGYDFLQIKSILDGNISLLGPKIGPYSELGNLYLGPAYYYILAPSLYLFRFDPLGPAVATAILSTLTVALIYLFCIRFFSKNTAIFSSLLYAINPFIITQSRAASNPHLIPTFAILAIFLILLVGLGNTKNKFQVASSGVNIGIIFQLHYIGAILLPIFFLYLLFQKKIKESLFFLLGFLLAISPQIIFELKHEFFVVNLFFAQLAAGKATSSFSIFFAHNNSSALILKEIIIGYGVIIPYTALLLFLTLLKGLKVTDTNKHVLSLFAVILIALFVSVNFYTGDANPHYFALAYPIFFIVIGFALSASLNLRKTSIKYLAALLLILIFSIHSLLNLNLTARQGYTMPLGWNLPGQKKASDRIVNDPDSNIPFNVASTLDGDTRAMPIRYLLAVHNKIPMDVEQYPQAQAIFLISRESGASIKNYNVWEISSFAPFNVINLGEIQNGISLYKLKKI